MPVPQPGTATTVGSTGTYDVARFGIEDGVCGTPRSLVKPTTRDGLVKRA